MDALPSTIPDRPLAGFDRSRFFGEIAADGQRVRVAALAGDDQGRLAFLSVAGYETSVSAALARFLKGDQLGFLPNDEQLWTEPSALSATRISFWLWRAEISGTREKQGVAFPRCASVSHGLLTPPALPPPPPRQADAPPPDPFAEVDALLTRMRSGTPDTTPLPPRIVLGDWHDEAPTAAAFFGHLRGLRVNTLPSLAWIDFLWAAGFEFHLITPLRSLGIRAWRLDGDPRKWNALLSDGVRRGLLPRSRPSADDLRHLHVKQ